MSIINHHTRKIFKKSFLKSVQCIFAFNKVEWTNEKKEKATRLLKSKGFDIKETGELPMIQAQRNMTIIVLSDKGLLIGMDKTDYSGFENFKEFLNDVMIQLLNVASVDSIVTSIFQKINSYKIDKSKVTTELTKEVVLSSLFTPFLLGKKVPIGTLEDDCFYTTQYKYEDKGDAIIIELIVNAMKPQEQLVDDFMKGLCIINNRLYDFWYESVQENVRKSMDVK